MKCVLCGKESTEKLCFPCSLIMIEFNKYRYLDTTGISYKESLSNFINLFKKVS
jgi:hypothetical protein